MNQQELITKLEKIAMVEEGSLTTDSLLKDLKWDSMMALEFQALADEDLNLQLEPTEINVAVSVGDLCKLVSVTS